MTWRRLVRVPSAAQLVATVTVLAVGSSVVSAAPTADVSGTRVAVGAWIPNSDIRAGRIDSYARLVGRPPVIVSRYPNWSHPPFDRTLLGAIWSRGAVPLVTWEPWNSASKGFPLKMIARGWYDGYIRRSARAAAAWGKPILLRFAHEMNGNWYPWGRRHGNSPRVYIAAWRHLVRIFRQYGANNVQWVWAPNVNEQAGTAVALPFFSDNQSHPFPFKRFYPGDKWVDWVGLDGFNWGRGGKWQSFTDIFASSYNTLIHMTSRPIIVAETGSNETGGDKAAWVASALSREIPQFPRIRAVVWFDEPFNGIDTRVNSSSDSLKAFRTAIASPRYAMTRNALLATPANLPAGSSAPSPPSGGFGQPSLLERIWHKVQGPYFWPVVSILIGLLLVLSIARTRRIVRTRRASRWNP